MTSRNTNDLDPENRAQLAAQARVSSKDKDEYKRNQQQTVVATKLAPFPKQSQSTVAVTSTVSKPKAKPGNLPTTVTLSTAKLPTNLSQKLLRPSIQDANGNDSETQSVDLSQDDTFHSELLDSPLIAKAGNKRRNDNQAKREENDYPLSQTPGNELALWNAYSRAANGEGFHLDEEEEEEGVEAEGIEEDWEEEDDDEEYDDDELVTKVFTPSVPQQVKTVINQPATVQRPQHELPAPHTMSVKYQSFKSRSNPFASSAAGLTSNSLAKSGHQSHVHFQGSPTRSKTSIVPVYETTTPSRGPFTGIKRTRSGIKDNHSSGKIGFKHSNARPASETKTISKAEELQAMDYNSEALAKKKFADLQSEPFDQDPQRVVGELEQHFGSDDMSLSDRLKRVYRTDDVEVQSAFFDSLATEEWEEAGDWFMDQFAELMKRAKEARKAKREIAAKFEDEIAKRHEAVEGRIERTMKTMEEMRRSGQVVLQANSVAFGKEK